MKTLKFMLAAATAIGLASASQAVGPTLGSTSFESYSGDITDQTDANQFVLPTGWEVGDYSIITEGLPSAGNRSAGAASKWSSNTKALKLEGGTEPFQIKVARDDVGEVIPDSGLFIDTLVQFTVTPADDVVATNSSDKLLIYLRDDGATTNLYARAGWWDEIGTFGCKDYQITLPAGVNAITPGTWYNLRVKALSDIDEDENEVCPGFQIFINDGLCINDGDWGEGYPGTVIAQNNYFVSLQVGQMDASKLKYVGFAGSGAVDDVLITTFNPTLTVIDFTLVLDDTAQGIDGAVYFSTEAMGRTELSGTVTGYCYGGQGATDKVTMDYAFKSDFGGTWSSGGPASATGSEYFTPTAGSTYTLTTAALITTVDFTFTLNTGVSSVLWTIDGATTNEVLATGTVTADSGAVLTIAGVNYAAWYVKASGSLGAGDTVTATAAANYQFSATSTASGTVPEGTTPADLGIDSAATGITASDLGKVAKWGSTKGGSVSKVNEIRFSNEGEATNDVAEAYLLDCAPTSEAIAAAKADFKFTSFDPSNPPDNTYFESKGYNGTVTIKGATVLGTWHDKASGDKFFKATLTK